MRKVLKSVLALLVCPMMFACCEKSNGNQTLNSNNKPNRQLVFADDNEFLDYVQQAHFNYMWEGAEPTSGLACERIHLDGIYPENDSDVITIGGSGFGVAGLIVGIERGFVTRQAGVARFHQIVDYLARADRFHGVWPHWLHGKSGRVKPFGTKDNGGDLVESAFLMQSLLCARQYFKDGNADEKLLAAKIDTLWREMDFNWYTNNQQVIYWHWSPDYHWEMNFPLEGYNECLITYILAASSPTYRVDPAAYHEGWSRSRGGIRSQAEAYGLPLVVKHNGDEAMGGPLFWAHYSYIGLNPNGLKDAYVDYGAAVRNHALINYRYCVANPKQHKGYGEHCWGLTASYSPAGYSAHSPANDPGVITPTAALSSFPYTPAESMQALKYFYFEKGDRLWGKYGFYDAFRESDNWVLPRYLAIDQCTIAPMIENHRTGLLWNLFMSCPEIRDGLTRLGFNY